MSSKINLQTCEYARKSSIFQDNQLICHKHAKVFDLYLELENGKSIGLFLQEMRSRNVKTETVETTKNKLPGKFSSLVVTLEVNHYNMRPELIDEIRNFDYVHYVEEM